jgi:hypothetical protein
VNIALEAATIEREIADLIDAYPDLADDETLRADMLAGSTNAFELLAVVVERMQEAKSFSEAIKARAKELSERSSRYAKRGDAMRAFAERIMRAADLRKAELPAATLSIRNTPPAVVITDEDDLPEAFWRVSRAPDKSAINDALKAGQFIPGAELSNGGEIISVRVA